ncbi:MAG: 5-formyltetrahydrofolate cyclo-ligase [Candidatus Diapherotrites archaeon]|nr:5-formyltetrahydrofolate cyclo-ligase [Candidatus Diapherotrites archaeon]
MKESKPTIRKKMKQKIEHEKQKLKKSTKIMEKLFKTHEFQQAKIIAFFVGRTNEVETKKGIEKTLKLGKTVCIPITNFKTKTLQFSTIKNFKELEEKQFQLMEPKKEFIRKVRLNKIDLLIIPGLGFDVFKQRLGFGKGFYDRTLKKLNKKTKTIGLCFDFQIVQKLPKEKHDQKVQKIITEKRMIE